MKAALRIGLLALAGLGLLVLLVLGVLIGVSATETGTRWVLGQALPRLNTGPDLGVQWRAAEGTLLRGLVLEAVRVDSTSDSLHIQVTIERLQFAWQPWRLLDRTLVLNEVQVRGLDYQQDTLAVVETEPLTPAVLQDLLFSLPVNIELQELDGTDIRLRIDDTPFAFDRLAGTAVLDGNHLALAQLQWQQGSTQVAGDLTLARSLEIDGTAHWQMLLGELDYAGQLDVAGSLESLQLGHALTQPLQVRSEGAVVPGLFVGMPVSLDLLHTFDTLDLAAFGQPAISVRQGRITTAGTPEALAISGMMSPLIEGFEMLNLAFNLGYQPGSVGLNSITVDSAEISLGASGSLQLDPLILDVDWMLNELDPGERLGTVQLTDVSGAGNVRLMRNDDNLDVSLALANLHGVVNAYPLDISGAAALRNAELTAVNLQARSQDNNLAITGSAAPTALALDWQLQAPELAQLWQGLDGAIDGSGTLRGTRELPEFSGQLDGQELSLQDGANTMVLESFSLAATHVNAENDIRLTLGALALQGTTTGVPATRQLLQQGQINATGTPARHTVNAALDSRDTDLDLRLQGGTQASGWQGTLQSAGIDSIYGNWDLQAPAALAWLDGSLSVPENCWSDGVTRVCLAADKPAMAGINAALVVSDIELAWLNPLQNAVERAANPHPKPQGLQNLQDARALNLPASLRMEGRLDLQASVENLQGGTWDLLSVALQPRAAVLQLTLIPDVESAQLDPVVQRFGLYDNTIVATSTKGNWDAELAFRIAREEETGSVDQGSFSSNVTMTESGDLDGRADFDFRDLAWLQTLAPTLRDPAGTLSGSTVVSGNRSSPVLDSRLDLRDGSFALPAYGLAIADVAVAIQTLPGSGGPDGSNTLTVEASAGSGNGTLTLSSRIANPLQDNRSFTAALGGTDFLAFNTSYATVTISPDLQLDYTGAAVTVAGRMEVPQMNIDLAELLGDMGTNAVAVSPDVVIVRTATGEDALAIEEGESLPLNVNVVLVLGDDVQLQGYGLDARLNGELMLEQAPNRPLLVYGELGIPEGSYEIYNQMLSTRDGRLMFFGNPANPVVDIRAFRQTATAEVGMVLSGNIKNMQGQLYSTPTLPESEILALLITGKSFNNVSEQEGDALLGAIANFGFERGQGLTESVSSKLGLDSVTVGGDGALEESALGLGKYLTPNLLMSYKVGLFDRQSVLSIDYTLSERLKLEVETGISQSVEISYTIEKD